MGRAIIAGRSNIQSDKGVKPLFTLTADMRHLAGKFKQLQVEKFCFEFKTITTVACSASRLRLKNQRLVCGLCRGRERVERSQTKVGRNNERRKLLLVLFGRSDLTEFWIEANAKVTRVEIRPNISKNQIFKPNALPK